MKTKPLTLLLIVACLLLASCHRTAQGAQSDNPSAVELFWSETDIVAVAFVGYCTSFDDFHAIPTYTDLKKHYALPDDIPFIDHTGDELYLVIPRDPNASVAVNSVPVESLTNPDTDAHGSILYKSEEGTPFFIRCQSSGGMTNAELIIVDNNKRELTYRPQLSTTDGSLMTPGNVGEGEGSVLDITQPQPTSHLPRSVDRPDDNLRAEIIDGRPVIFVKEDVQALENGPHPVERITGRCVGLYLSRIGDSKLYNDESEAEADPWLFMLMDDGGVEALAYRSIYGFDPTLPGHFISSGRLPDLKDITGFRTETGGTTHTVYAIDKSGARHEIRPCLLPKPYQQLYGYADGKEHQLLIYPDGKIEYLTGTPPPPEMPFGDDIDKYFGRLHPSRMDAKAGVYEFTYDMLTYEDFVKGDGEKAFASPTRGAFRLTTPDGGKTYNLTVLSGRPDFFGFPYGTPARFTHTRLNNEGKPLWGEE